MESVSCTLHALKVQRLELTEPIFESFCKDIVFFKTSLSQRSPVKVQLPLRVQFSTIFNTLLLQHFGTKNTTRFVRPMLDLYSEACLKIP